MQTRRDFLRQTSLATTALLVADQEWFKKKPTIGVQHDFDGPGVIESSK